MKEGIGAFIARITPHFFLAARHLQCRFQLESGNIHPPCDSYSKNPADTQWRDVRYARDAPAILICMVTD